jgi:hypothetical protein
MKPRTDGIRFLLSCLFGLSLILSAGCQDSDPYVPVGAPSPPENFDATYYAQAVHLSWELAPGWDGEPFRVWAKRVSDANFFLIAEVTACAGGVCSYLDSNVAAGVTYVYYVTAVGPTGLEASSDISVEVHVPQPIAPPRPGSLDVISLDGALFVTWGEESRQADDFAFYRVYLEGGDGAVFLLGETDSEGFLDSLVENGNTYGYFVTALDDQGHESERTELAEGTPRPDYHGELLYAYQDRPEDSGFRFQDSEETLPVVPGDDVSRDFRIEADETGWWLVPAPGVEIATESFFTTALRCGPASDVGCIDVRSAPTTGYDTQAAQLLPEFAYVVRVPAEGSGWYHGLIRVTHVGFAQDGALVLFDWAFQLQQDNPNLMIGTS